MVQVDVLISIPTRRTAEASSSGRPTEAAYHSFQDFGLDDRIQASDLPKIWQKIFHYAS